MASPRLRRLAHELRTAGAPAAETFWTEVRAAGAPLVEPAASGAPDERLVTFVWRDAAPRSSVALVGGFATNPADARLTRLAGSDVWYRTYRVAAGARAAYLFAPDGPDAPQAAATWADEAAAWRRDPLNPRTWLYPADPDGEAPHGDPQERGLEWSRIDVPGPDPGGRRVPSAAAAPGERGRPEVHRHRLASPTLAPAPWLPADLRQTRRVWVHRAGRSGSGRPWLLVLLDGWDYVHLIPTAAILDGLAARGGIPPVVAVFVDNPVFLREDDFTAGPAGEPARGLAAFLADTVLPWARRVHGATRDPRRAAIGGLSLGGFAAASLAVRRPDLFGNVLSQSGSFWWGPPGGNRFEWLTDLIEEGATAGGPVLRFDLSVGTLETWPPVADGAPTLLAANRRLRDVLARRGWLAAYREFSGGHHWICWEAALGAALETLLGPGPGGDGTRR